jgi:hypothetical protein
LCAHFGLLAGLQQVERVAFSQNAALDHARVPRLVEQRAQATLASR